jgi:protein ImuB
MARRIVAVVLPQLGCELVRQKKKIEGPLAVLFTGEHEAEAQDRATANIHLVDDAAWRYGLRPGQRVAEAQATLAELSIQTVSFAEIDAALGRVAEVCLGLGTTAAIRLSPERADDDARRSPTGDAPFDTVFLDVTGAAHLVGGEEALTDELGERILHTLGHKVQIAIADGPRLARALARFAMNPALQGSAALAVRKSPQPSVLAKPGANVLGPLPVHALPLPPDTIAFFGRLGIFNIEALSKLPPSELTPRLGPRAREVLELCRGRDELPLVPYAPPRLLVEEASFDDPVSSTEPLLFVLRAMTSRVAARLGARGEACLSLEMLIPFDRSIARLKDPTREDASLSLTIDLPSALADANDLHRALRAKLERVELFAPATGIRLEVSQIVPSKGIQIDLSRDKTVRPDALPTLLAELSAEIGQERVGLLEVLDSLRPEARSRLAPLRDLDAQKRPAVEADPPLDGDTPLPEPTRLLPKPLPIGRIAKNAVIAVDQRLYAIEELRFVMRLDGVEWWTRSPASRDYGLAWLVPGAAPGKSGGKAEGSSRSPALAWVYVDRATGEGYLQGWCE